MHRVALSLITCGALAASLAACGGEATSQTCKAGRCDIQISGKDSTIGLGGDDGPTLKLLSASGSSAKVNLEGSGDLELKKDGSVVLETGVLSLKTVNGTDDVELVFDGSTSLTQPSGTTPKPTLGGGSGGGTS